MKFVFQTIKHYWINHLLTTLVFIISTLAIATFTSLFISALIYDRNAKNQVFLFFLILFGVSYILSWFLVTQVLKLNFKVRIQEIKNFRFLGLTFHKVYSLLLKEFLLISILPLVIGLTCYPILTKSIIHLFQNQDILTNDFKLNQNPLIYLGIIILTWLLISLVTYSTIFSTKKHFLIRNLKQKSKQKKAIIIKTIFGVIIIICFILLISFFQDKVLYLFGGIIFLIGFTLAGFTLIKGFFWCWKFIIQKRYLSYLGASRFYYNLFKIVVLLSLGILIFSLANFSFNTLNEAETGNFQENIWGRALNLVAIILSFMVCLFGLIVILVTSYLYFDAYQQNNYDLMQLGVKKRQIYFLNLIEGLMISIAILIVSLIPSLMVDIIYHDVAAVNNIGLWLGLTGIVVLPNILMPIICVTKSLKFSQRKDKN
ncbi:hypothetical protein LT335_00300 [Spiroplasma sp. JKS002669]|uniref:FtsX-like permease family protein n=1 Tax=Spiroplasma attinicola TaxID=2904537 RepID=UPI002022E31B|nr:MULTISPECIES: FtsX-like permease family protein [unclassified Spiroplasma]MCL6428752.1 hypothetical protein [Spiroplasma sp. JKS002669]MCL8210119.1 hypothetical protein [Spiroplasma sp. JKS002670]